jgi:hypothetical protein
VSQRTLEERVAALEREVAELRAAVANGAEGKDWLSTVGMFTGDEVMKRIDEAALAYREADRRKARRRQTETRRAKS